MPHDRLDDLQVGLFFAKPCAERVPQVMCRKVRQQNRFAMLLLRFYFLARIVVCNNALDGTVHRLRIRNIAKAVAEDEARLDNMEAQLAELTARPKVEPLTQQQYNRKAHEPNVLYVIVQE